MVYSPIQYDQPLFRPPSEANSLILQVTIGCSWNKCAFCEMYTSKQFRIRQLDDIQQDIKSSASYYPGVKKVFLADGNAMVLSFDKLNGILMHIREEFPKLLRISAYASSRDLENKTEDELKELVNKGLKLLYVGIESGDDDLLYRINKGETYASTVSNLLKARRAGLKLSVMILTGLGGREYSKQHAEKSAAVVSEIQPEYLSTLVISFPYGIDHFRDRFKGNYVEMDPVELLQEQYHFISNTRLNKVIFRSDHASNYLVLKGLLDKDKEIMLDQLHKAIQDPENGLRKEWQRGL